MAEFSAAHNTTKQAYYFYLTFKTGSHLPSANFDNISRLQPGWISAIRIGRHCLRLYF